MVFLLVALCAFSLVIDVQKSIGPLVAAWPSHDRFKAFQVVVFAW